MISKLPYYLAQFLAFLMLLGTLALAGCVHTVGEDYSTDIFDEVNDRAGG